MVTSPGGTSAEAIYQMEKSSLLTVLSKAVYAAYRRAVELGGKIRKLAENFMILQIFLFRHDRHGSVVGVADLAPAFFVE